VTPRARRSRRGRRAGPRDPDLLRIYAFADLVAASARSQRQRERLVRAAGVPITGAHLAALGLVGRHGPIAVSELAQRLRIDPSTASRHLRALEERRLVARKSEPGDRRISRLVLTGAGRDVLLRTRDVALNDFEVALGDWSPPDRSRLAALLERLHADLLRARVDESGWSIGKVEVSSAAEPAGHDRETSPRRRDR
jgi:DNA-binding MarR family transcriptional regulator